MTRKSKNRIKKIWKKELSATWKRGAHKHIKILNEDEKSITKENGWYSNPLYAMN